MRLISSKQAVVLSVVMATMGGCIPLHRHPATNPSTEPIATQAPTTQPTVGALGGAANVPGVTPKPKPFIALPRALNGASAKPSTLLLEHASPDSPVPLSDFSRQPLHDLEAFKLHKGLTVDQVQQQMGAPAQVADTEDSWLVYRLNGYRELWLHFTGPEQLLNAADVVRSAEDGYVRDRVFSAE